MYILPDIRTVFMEGDGKGVQPDFSSNFPDKTYVITDYYNGKDSLYTDAINRAIEACSSQGGGTVLVPDGEFLTAPIRLKSNVNLHLSDSTILKFTTDYNLFEPYLHV